MLSSGSIRGVLTDELERNSRMLRRYEIELQSLPKGSLVCRRIGSNEYYYESYREKGKVISRYLGKKGDFNEAGFKDKIQNRRRLQVLIKNLKKERSDLERLLK